MIRHIPNLLSISRIPTALLVLAVYRQDDPVRAWVSIGLILLAVATDLVDGHLARRYGVASRFGYVLDGLGDRAVHLVAYLLLYDSAIISIYLVWALTFRELAQYGVRVAEPAWHVSQPSTDRIVSRTYTMAVHVALLVELARNGLASGAPNSTYTIVVNAGLCAVAVASYSRILLRAGRAWKEAASS